MSYRACTVHLTSVHPATDPRILTKECVTLREAGYQVTLVARGPAGTTQQGVTVRAVHVPSGRFRRMTIGGWRVFRAALRERAAVFHIHDPELLPFGLLLKVLGKRVIYDVHEDLPRQIQSKTWLPKWSRTTAAAAAAAVEAVAGRSMDVIIAATPPIARRFPVAKTILVQNYPIHREFPTDPPRHSIRPMEGVYVGSVTARRGIAEMTSAVGHVHARHGFRLKVAGVVSPPELADEIARSPGGGRVDFLGWQERAEVIAQLCRARVGLLLLHPTPAYRVSQPTKLYEYMLAGLPVIASDFEGWRDIVNRAQAGFLVDPFDGLAVAQAVEWILEHPGEAEEMGSRGSSAARNSFSWSPEGARLVAAYDRLLGIGHGDPAAASLGW